MMPYFIFYILVIFCVSVIRRNASALIETEGQTKALPITQTIRLTDRRTHRLTDRQTDGHTDRQTDRQTDTQTDRHTHRRKHRRAERRDRRDNEGETDTLKQKEKKAKVAREELIWQKRIGVKHRIRLNEVPDRILP